MYHFALYSWIYGTVQILAPRRGKRSQYSAVAPHFLLIFKHYRHFTCTGALQLYMAIGLAMLLANRQATWVCEMWMHTNVYNYRDRISTRGFRERDLEAELATCSQKKTYPLPTHWISFSEHYSRPQLTNEPVAVRHPTCSTSNDNVTACTNNYTGERQYSKVHYNPNIRASQRYLYKAIPKYMYYTADAYHTGVDQRKQIQAGLSGKCLAWVLFPPNGFHMVRPTVMKSIFQLVDYSCRIIIFVCTSPAQHRYRHCYTSSTSSD